MGGLTPLVRIRKNLATTKRTQAISDAKPLSALHNRGRTMRMNGTTDKFKAHVKEAADVMMGNPAP
jgi:hypothetical protein